MHKICSYIYIYIIFSREHYNHSESSRSSLVRGTIKNHFQAS